MRQTEIMCRLKLKCNGALRLFKRRRLMTTGEMSTTVEDAKSLTLN